MESYAHKAAKTVVAGWLRSWSAATPDYGYVANPWGLSWRPNRGLPTGGIYEECPILSDGTGILPCWDEVVDTPEGLPPTYDELIALGTPPVAVIDIAIQHKGYVAYGIEIVFKHPLTDKKKRILWDFPDRFGLLAIPADWVLNQIGIPESPIPEEFRVW